MKWAKLASFIKGLESWFKVFIKSKGQTFFYNGEFDPGSGWTLAAGLIHASRGAAG